MNRLLPALLQFLVLAPLALVVTVFVHELGHAVAARARGFRVTSFGVGLSRPLWTGRVAGMRAFVCLGEISRGLTTTVATRLLPRRGDWAWMLAGGPLANLALAGAAFPLWQAARGLPVLGDFLFWLWLLGGASGLANLFPFAARFGAAPMLSDGAQILQVLAGRGTEAPAPVRVERCLGLRPLWQAVRDPEGEYFHLLAAAIAWAEMGNAGPAGALLHEAELRLTYGDRFAAAYGRLAAGAVAASAGDADLAEAYLAAAGGVFQSLGGAGAEPLLEAGRAEVALLRGDGRAAAERLAGLLRQPEIARNAPLRGALLASRVRALWATGDLLQVEAAQAEYAASAGRTPPTSQLRAVALARARHLRAGGALQEAAEAYQEALACTRDLYAAFTRTDLQREFLEGQREVVDEAQAAFLAANREDLCGWAAQLFPDPADFQAEQAHWRRAANRRRHRLGLALLAVNAGAALLTLRGVLNLAASSTSADRIAPLVALLAGLLLFSTLGGLYAAGLWLAARWWPALRETGGGTTLLLALMPWITWLVALPFRTVGEERRPAREPGRPARGARPPERRGWERGPGMPKAGIEPALLSEPVFETGASACSATSAEVPGL